MMSTFLLSQLALILFGFGAGFHPTVRSMTAAARIGIAFIVGSLLLSVEATLFSTIAIPWSVATLAAPLIVLNGAAAWIWSRRKSDSETPDRGRVSPELWITSMVLGGLAVVHLAASFITTRKNSVDLIFFWGVKALLFAEAGGIDAEFLKDGYSSHAHPTYPPLFTVSLVWSNLVSGKFDWLAAPLTAVLWVAAAIPILFALLQRRMEKRAAVATTTLWTVIMCISLASSYSGGNAEAALFVNSTIAATALMLESRTLPSSSRFLPSLALAGCIMTKVEGLVIAGLIVGGTILRDLVQRRELIARRSIYLIVPSLVAGSTWPLFEFVYGMPLSDPLRRMSFNAVKYAREIFVESLRRLNAGTWGMSWAISFLLLLSNIRGKFVELLPGLSLTFGLLGFYLVYYFSHSEDPTVLIGWTMSRISQPSLSMLVVTAGMACFSFSRSGSADPASPSTDEV